MNFFEDLVVELKEENLLESTVMESGREASDEEPAVTSGLAEFDVEDEVAVPTESDVLEDAVLTEGAGLEDAVVTENTGAKDAVYQGGGWVIPANDAPALRTCLLHCLKNRGEIEMKGRQAQSIARQYTWAYYYQQVADILAEIARRENLPV